MFLMNGSCSSHLSRPIASLTCRSSSSSPARVPDVFSSLQTWPTRCTRYGLKADGD